MSEIHSVGPFILGKSLGAGATGKVKLGFHKDTGFKVAIKIMNKEFLSSRPSMRKKVEREIVVMKLIDHQNVLKLHDVYETSKYLFLVMEYVEGGELFDYLINKGSLEPAEALKFFQQLVRGLDHCHSQRICHRDLKPENLLLDSDRNIKIGDFGMASLMRRGSLLSTSCGSPHYASPEVVTGKQYSGMAADIWSCGVILYALLTGKLPFDDDDIRKLLGKVKAGAFTMPAFLPKDAQDLISKMLTVDPSKRITITQIKDHPWFTSAQDPQAFLSPVSVEDMSAEPLQDAAAIDDEILRSLKVLGLGSDMDIEHSLTSKKPNLTLVFYRLLEARKEQQINNSYSHATRNNRNRGNTSDTRERSLSEHVRSQSYQEGKARSNSFTQPEGAANNSRVLSLNSKQRRPSPLVDAAKRAPASSSSQGMIFPLSPSNSSSNTATLTITDDTATIVSIANSNSSEFNPNNSAPHSPRTSPPLNRTSPPTARYNGNNKKQYPQSPPPSPPVSTNHQNSSSPIAISNRNRIMKLANEASSSPTGSPIIGSNPKRSWFSNFFTGSPHNSSPLDDEDGPNLTIREPNGTNNHSNNTSFSPNFNINRDHGYQRDRSNSDHSRHTQNQYYNSPEYSRSNHHNHHNSHSYHNPHPNLNGPNHNGPIHNGSTHNGPTHNGPTHNGTHNGANYNNYNNDYKQNYKPPQTQPQQINNKPSDLVVRTSMEMQTGKSGVELGAEIQRTLSALKTSWRLQTNELYTAKYDAAEGLTCQFSVELIDLKTNNLNLVSISHLSGQTSFFQTLCNQFQAEVKL